MSTTKDITCVVCPAGCKITVTLDGTAITDISGFTCQRGKKYAESEVTNPVRTLTSTVSVISSSGKKMLPVRTDKPISKDKLFDGMTIVRNTTVNAPVKAGDIIVSDFTESGINLIACKSIN
jgi:CxxC motif-containing protein